MAYNLPSIIQEFPEKMSLNTKYQILKQGQIDHGSSAIAKRYVVCEWRSEWVCECHTS